MMRISALLCFIVWLISGTAPAALAGSTLDKIKVAGSLPCGINTELPEYSTQDAHGNHAPFDQDICKAVAVAVLGTNAKFTIVPFNDEQDALKALNLGRSRYLPRVLRISSIQPTRAWALARPSSMTIRASL